ncbi:hypothetical protein J7T55_000365 [Diaporthe amygdali]|uniref:uncharacterized protein n=1 Tax=Phomopsis amygdali TaxID=1214568 RepID=UPI0022FEFD60|nr:uncharacterized protein J7T55_000365 [Diaporthe amygdali]KAJ0109440.1 hypothetical protein J7T55_000365 [Diaporthe amygdali]
MSRWGMCLFQGDQDQDIRGEIEDAMGLVKPDDEDYDPDKELQSTAFCKKWTPASVTSSSETFVLRERVFFP